MDVAQISLPGFIYNISVDRKIIPAAGTNLSDSSLAQISELSRSLNGTNIDIKNSNISQDDNGTQFDIKLFNQYEKDISFDGYFSKDYRKGEVSFNFVYPKKEVKDGKETEKNYQVNFKLSFASEHSISVKKSENKEDIMEFLSRVMRKIFSKLGDKESNLTAVVLDAEDLKELAEISDKKVLQLIYRLIDMVNMAIDAKKMSKKDSGQPGEVYHPKRETSTVTETKVEGKTSIDYSFSIKETKEVDNTVN